MATNPGRALGKSFLQIFFSLLTILGSFSPIAPVEIGITGQARALPSESVSCVFVFFHGN